ncbi:MAG: hypothetical protein R3B90_21410 [Planctomycetaceae bacterium]
MGTFIVAGFNACCILGTLVVGVFSYQTIHKPVAEDQLKPVPVVHAELSAESCSLLSAGTIEYAVSPLNVEVTNGGVSRSSSIL